MRSAALAARLLLASLAWAGAASPSRAASVTSLSQAASGASTLPSVVAPSQPALTAPAQPASQPTVTQALSISAGTGVLLTLASPAATVLSADPSIARVQPASPTSLFLMGVAPGDTTIIATNQAGSAIVQYNIHVTQGSKKPETAAVAPPMVFGGGSGGGSSAPAKLSPAEALAVQAAIAQSVSGAQGVRTRAVGTDLILTGNVPTAIAAQQAEAIARGYVGSKAGVIDQMAVLGSIQVNVRVRIAEINRQITRQLGFNWQALGRGNGWRFGLLTGAATGGLISPLAPLGLTPLANAVTPYQVGSGFTSGNGLWDVNSVIDALAADNLITILAEPNLTAQSGETASFLAGGEFPVPSAGQVTNGALQLTVEYKPYGVSLALVPTVISPSRISLRIRPEVSQLSSNGAINEPIGNGTLTIPALTVRRAETTVELGSGQSFAIAGLLQSTSANVTNALPGIGELPVIGSLFKSNDFQRGESELVIIVTPYIVRPVDNPQALRAPTDGFRPATDMDRILYGKQIAPASMPRVDAGFVVK